MAEIVFNCSGCMEILSIGENDIGQEVECPHCEVGVTVPDAVVDFRCLDCKTMLCAPEPLLGSKVNCPNCEKELTVPNFTNRRPRLKFRNAGADGRPVLRSDTSSDALSETLYRVTARVQRDKEERPGFHIFRHQWSNIVFGLLAFVTAFLLIVYLVPLKNTHEAIFWRQAAMSLTRLKSNPGDEPALRMLRASIQNTRTTSATKDVRSKLMAVYALGKIISGDDRGGTHACNYVAKQFPGSEAAGYVATSARMAPCPNCGRSTASCSRCGGTGNCPTCKGSGQKAGGLSGSSGSGANCLSCRGSGRCPQCRSSSTGRTCLKCRGAGVVPSKQKLLTQYQAAIEDSEPQVRRKAASSGVKRWLAGIQKWMYKIVPRRGFAGRSNSDPVLFEVPEDKE